MKEWPPDLPLRLVIYWSLRLKEYGYKPLCDVGLCDKAVGREPCAECPIRRIWAAQQGATGELIYRANELRAIIALGVTIPIDDLDADELSAMQFIEIELDRLEKEKRERKD